jgi:hypothetical protein
MFSMTEMAAHKIYRAYMLLPRLAINLLVLFGCPIVAYMSGFALGDSGATKIVIALVLFIVIGLPISYVIRAVHFGLTEVFSLVIDVVPTHGLSRSESRAILEGGRVALDEIEFGKNIRNVDPALIERISRRGLFGYFFRKRVEARIMAVVRYYTESKNEVFSAYRVQEVLRLAGLEQPWYEKAVNNQVWRSLIIQIFVFVYLLLAQPKL